MKLLLTSAGITNDSLANALKSLVKGSIKIAFIPTAANVSDEKKDWLIRNFNECERLGTVDIVDISALSKPVWLPRLKKANVIFVGGGNTSYLMKCISSSGLKKELSPLLKSRVYVGISAGSIVTNKTLQPSSGFIFGNKEAPEALGMVDFYIRPHMNAPNFRAKKIDEENLDKIANRFNADLYAIDDNSAVLVNEGKIQVISEGTWKLYKGSK